MSFDQSEHYYQLGLGLLRQGQPELALQRFLEASRADSTNAAPGLRAIDLLGELDRPQEAILLSRDLFSRYRDDGMELILSCPLPAIPAHSDDVDAALAFYEERLSDIAKRPGLRIEQPHLCQPKGHFLLPYHDRPVKQLREAQAALFLKAHPELAYAAPHVSTGNQPGKRPRLGVVSSLLAAHTVGMITVPLLSSLIRHGIDLHLFLASPAEDAQLAGLKAEAAACTLLPQDLAQARQTIAASRLDALLYPEIGMDPFVYCLAFARLAPLQLMMWGHPMTSGLSSIDGFISSHLIEPQGADAHYTERLIRLPVMPIVTADHLLPDPPSRASLGLAENKRLYVCPQSPFKLSPAFDRALAGILAADPEGEIVLLEGQKPGWKDRLLARLAPHLGENKDRLRFLPRLDRISFLGLLANADVLLDPFGFSGGNTSAEALANGTPIVTLPGRTMAGRVTLGFLGMLRIDDTVAVDEADYIRLAVATAKAKAQYRARLLAAGPLLFGLDKAARLLADVFANPQALESRR
ncbi:MAG: hypothetical protein WC722_07105 [Rhodospirillales bacterium]|jgi:predicted O-linked N-acetylglucosamine transferase (SPINDLY family)